ncbi:hypothetical protein NDR87_26345 [Nocardia sp. CDC159]|uniref:DUF7172 domain-containing protein n=1 Tax=Nocardia pulmonis TaxID=2951408 RepID=A0A9X2IX33_9NOCA|nr:MULTISPECIES: hypothetical protein [Nocardia]MCM6774968.1 hypothetical protein [Nocardia pulmonis]MCM6789899.1 hypothetical protein [Nocardia sp. CDC159]
MSLRICTSEWMISNLRGTDLAEAWLPRVAASRYATSARDGQINNAPDAVPLIDTDLIWTNTTGAWQNCHLGVHRAPRSIVTSNPNTVVLDDAVSWDIGTSPRAALPSAVGAGIGARVKTTPSQLNQTIYSRLFNDWDDWTSLENIGAVAAGETVHVRYQCLLTTPGEWRGGTSPLHQAHARWVRLRLLCAPLLEVI